MAEDAAWRHQQRGTNGEESGLQTEIAIVDDDPMVRGSLARLLKAYSYRVQTYESAQEFLKSERVQVPDCLIVDQYMEEMTGEELLHHLAHSGTRIPAIVLTGQNEPGSRERFQQAGAVKFLEKPVTPDQLLRAIETALSTKLLH
jgi:FixJ family two-component response regulator